MMHDHDVTEIMKIYYKNTHNDNHKIRFILTNLRLQSLEVTMGKSSSVPSK